MNNPVKDLKILSFKVIFKCLKLVESYKKKNSVKNIWLEDQLILMNFFENLKVIIFKVLFLLKMSPIFVSSVYNFGKSNNDIIHWQSTYSYLSNKRVGYNKRVG